MAGQYAKDSNGSSQSVSEPGSEPDSIPSETDTDLTWSGDDRTQYKFPSPEPMLMVQTKSPLLPSVPRSKSTPGRTTPAVQNVPEINKSGNNNADASANPTAIVPKKRHYIYTPEENNSAKKHSASSERISVETTKNHLNEQNPVSPIKESRNKPKNATEKSHKKTVSWSTDVPPVKKHRQSVKNHSQAADPIDEPPVEQKHQYEQEKPKKVSAKRNTKKVFLTSHASEKKAEGMEVPVSAGPSSIKVATSKKLSGASHALEYSEQVECVNVLPVSDGPPSSKVPSNKSIKHDRFWSNTLSSDFDTPDYESLLKKSQFTEEQTVLIKESFHLVCQKLHIATTYTDRFMKTHKCTDCDFSISHQCESVQFSQYVRSNANVMSTTTFPPGSMNLCVCGFGFLHSHDKNQRSKSLDNLSAIKILRLVEHYRSVQFSCPKCHMNIDIRNRNNNVCSDFTNWHDLKDTRSNMFYKFLEDRLRLSSMYRPNLNELYTCRRRCCEIFHRCPENATAVPFDASVNQLFPVTTYTRSHVTRSND